MRNLNTDFKRIMLFIQKIMGLAYMKRLDIGGSVDE
jgi:hypothetical protein